MPRAKYRPRIVIECTQEQRNTLNTHIEHGMQRKVLSVILEDVISLLNEFGHLFVLFMLERRFTYREQVAIYAAQRLAGSTTEDVDEPAAVGLDTGNP